MQPNRARSPQAGLTVIELIVVIVLIAFAVGLVVYAVTAAHEKSRIAKTVDQIAQLNNATQLYLTDTLRFPPDCAAECDDSNDPYMVNAGNVDRWNGPYLLKGASSLRTPWGGRYRVATGDVTGSGEPYSYFFLDSLQGAAPIPTDSLQKIDATIDDGDLAAGLVRGDGLGFGAAAGELVILFHQ